MNLFQTVTDALDKALADWKMMQQTDGDEGAEWAERFERHFYEFSALLKDWFHTLSNKPKELDEAEQLPEIQTIVNKIPQELYLNFTIELEEIIDGIETTRFD